MMRNYSYDWNSPKDERLEKVLWAHWTGKTDKVFQLLTRICLTEVMEDYDNEQTQQAAH